MESVEADGREVVASGLQPHNGQARNTPFGPASILGFRMPRVEVHDGIR